MRRNSIVLDLKNAPDGAPPLPNQPSASTRCVEPRKGEGTPPAPLSSFLKRSQTEKENWRYTDLKALLVACPKQTKIVPFTPTPNAAQLLFLNGVFQPAASHFASVPSCILMGDSQTGYHLVLGEQTCLVAQPIELVFVTDDNAPDSIAIKLSITLGANGRLTLLENHRAARVPVVMETDMTLHTRAKFVHGKIVAGGCAHLSLTQAHLSGGAYYNSFALLRDALTRNETSVYLDAPEAQAVLSGIMRLGDSSHGDTTVRVFHQAPDCSSRQTFRTVLDGKARGVFQGKITVAEGAQRTDAAQLSRALLLSDQSEMDAKPELEIYADDVKCSHGSAIGNLDSEALFYLRARGLSEAEARALLIEAFLSEILDTLPTEDWRETFTTALQEA